MRLTGETAALALITVGGAAVRAYRLDAADLWLDEANTLLRGIQPLGLMLRELATADVHPPLFYLLLKAPLAFSTSELALRVLPWLFGVLQIPLAYLIARDLNGPAAGLVAALLTAVSAPLVVFSQEGRMYSLLALLVLAATWSLVRALERSDARWWAAFALASTAALYTHNMAGLFLVAHLLAAIGSAPTRRIVGVGAVCLALYLPWLP
ncbi:MAG TPA: glycosyltransferase family 39 protein, partial [Chloroflexota bacterium]